MALQTFPLGLTDFANGLPLATIKFRPNKRMQTSGETSGKIIAIEVAPDYWSVEVSFRPLYSQEARAFEAMIDSLDGGLNDFYIFDPISAYPVLDPKGANLGASSITNTNIHSSNKAMKFTGFPVGYVLSPGDVFCYDYGPGNIYRAYHRITSGGDANSDWISFRPALPDITLSTGKAMDFTKASIRAKMVYESIDYGQREDIFTSGIGFLAEQVP
jgi:hypothetical protein